MPRSMGPPCDVAGRCPVGAAGLTVPGPLVVLALLAGACTGASSEDDKAGFQLVDPGTGAASTRPLSPTYGGVRREYGVGLVTTALGATERWGKTVVRFQGSDDVRFFRMSDTLGLLYDGTTRIGQVKPPIVLLPPAVKDGMKWQILGASGALIGTFTVAALGETATVLGRQPLWRVTQRNEVTGNEFMTDYAEGRGAVAVDGAALVAAVVPLEPRPARKVRPRLALTAAGDGKPLSSTLSARVASLVQPATGPATLRIGGATAWYSSDQGQFIQVPGVLCAQVAGGVVTPSDVQVFSQGSSSPPAACDDASASVLHGGRVVGLTVTPDGVLEGPLGGPFVDGDGVVRAIGALFDRYDNTQWVRDEPGMNKFADGAYAHGGSLHLPWKDEGPVTQILVGVVQAQDDVGFVVRMGDRLLHGRSNKQGFSALRFIGSVPGARVSARLDASGRRHLFVGTDGTVDELTITAETATLQRLAELDLPEGHELVAALPGEPGSPDLLVLTLADRPNWTDFQRAQPKLGDLHAWHAALPAPVADPAAYESPSAPELNIVAMATGPDVQVCWPSGMADTAGWTLGGHPAKAFSARADGSCVVVLRDQSLPFDPTAIDAWLVEGPVPGVGRVAIAQHPDRASKSLTTPEAQLALGAIPGGFASTALLYGPSATPVAAPPAPAAIASQSIRPGFVDAGGFGVWGIGIDAFGECGLSPKPCVAVRRWDSGFTVIHAPDGGNGTNHRMVAPLAGGGLLWQTIPYNDTYLVHIDGTLLNLPKVDGSQYFGARNDGLACGVRFRTIAPNRYEEDLLCHDPDGTIRAQPIPEAQALLVNLGWWPGAGGFYAPPTPPATSVMYVDPAALTITPLDLQGYVPPARGAVTAAWSATGELFLLVQDLDAEGSPAHAVLQVANGKVTASLPIAKGWAPLDPDPRIARTPVLLVGPEVLTVTTNGSGPRSLVRLVRP